MWPRCTGALRCSSRPASTPRGASAWVQSRPGSMDRDLATTTCMQDLLAGGGTHGSPRHPPCPPRPATRLRRRGEVARLLACSTSAVQLAVSTLPTGCSRPPVSPGTECPRASLRQGDDGDSLRDPVTCRRGAVLHPCPIGRAALGPAVLARLGSTSLTPTRTCTPRTHPTRTEACPRGPPPP